MLKVLLLRLWNIRDTASSTIAKKPDRLEAKYDEPFRVVFEVLNALISAL